MVQYSLFLDIMSSMLDLIRYQFWILIGQPMSTGDTKTTVPRNRVVSEAPGRGLYSPLLNYGLLEEYVGRVRTAFQPKCP